MLDSLLEKLRDAKGSDLHLATGSPPRIRQFGKLKAIDAPPLTGHDVVGILRNMMDDVKKVKELKNVDFAYDSPTLKRRYRCNSFLQKSGPNLVMRAIEPKIPTLEELGLPPILEKFTQYRTGLVLCTGPAGCGKTSTMAALVNIINEDRPEHIITVEDPVEYIHTPKKALINQRQVGKNVASFGHALRAALREDPDVIVVGELRDTETISLAITAAETGHLVMGTLHTKSAVNTVDRLIDAFPADRQNQVRQMLAESLRGVVSQQLLPRKDGQGQALALELFTVNNAIASMIRSGDSHKIPMAITTGGKQPGMRAMDDSLSQLVNEGIISVEEALLVCNEPETFNQKTRIEA